MNKENWKKELEKIGEDVHWDWDGISSELAEFINKTINRVKKEEREKLLEKTDKLVADHYWDSLEKDRDLVIKHFQQLKEKLKKI